MKTMAQNNLWVRVIRIWMACAFLLSAVLPGRAYAQNVSAMALMPAPGQGVILTNDYRPAMLKGMAVDPKDPFKFDFIIGRGDDGLGAQEKKDEYTKLIKYFLAALAVPDTDQWVNLSPYEKDRIIADNFGLTEMGRDLLAQDYLLKQLSASLSNPDSELGKKFWAGVYAKAYEKFGTTDVPTDVFNKIWIIPDKAVVYEKDGTVYILEHHLKVMTETDYLAMKNNTPEGAAAPEGTAAISLAVMREVIIPAVEKEVNEGKNFAPVRQVFSGMLLATWYKIALKESILSKVYGDRSKVKGIDQDPAINQEIYQKYTAAFRQGVVNMIREDTDAYSQELIPRKYFSGGVSQNFAKIISVKSDELSRSEAAQNAAQADIEVVKAKCIASDDSGSPKVLKGNDVSAEDRLFVVKQLLKGRGVVVDDPQRPVLFRGEKGIFENGIVPSTFKRGRSQMGRGLFLTESLSYALKYVGIGNDGSREPRRTNAYLAAVQLNIPIENIPVVDIEDVLIQASKKMSLFRKAFRFWESLGLPNVRIEQRLSDMMIDKIIANRINNAPAYRFFFHGSQGPQDIAIRDPRVLEKGQAIMLDLNDIASPEELKRDTVEFGAAPYAGINGQKFMSIDIAAFQGMYKNANAAPDNAEGAKWQSVVEPSALYNTADNQAPQPLMLLGDDGQPAKDTLDGLRKSWAGQKEVVLYRGIRVAKGAAVQPYYGRSDGRGPMFSTSWKDAVHYGVQPAGIDGQTLRDDDEVVVMQVTIPVENLEKFVREDPYDNQGAAEGAHHIFLFRELNVMHQSLNYRQVRGDVNEIEKMVSSAMADTQPAVKPGTTDAASYGGIDFARANLDLQIKRDGNGVPLPVSQQNLENIRIDGLVPVILDIAPAGGAVLFKS
ncbi:MAG: hypothetical protein WCO69_06205 [Candidatus Omnitrophota bacterium]